MLFLSFDNYPYDHYPIYLMLGEESWGLTPVKGVNAWVNHPSFSQMVEAWWSLNPMDGWPGHGFIQKLKRLKGLR